MRAQEGPAGVQTRTNHGLWLGASLAIAALLIVGLLAVGASCAGQVGSGAGSSDGVGQIANGSGGPDIYYGGDDSSSSDLIDLETAGDDGSGDGGGTDQSLAPGATLRSSSPRTSSKPGSSPSHSATHAPTPTPTHSPTPSPTPNPTPTPTPAPPPTIGTITLGQTHQCYRLDNGQVVGSYPAGTVWPVYGTIFANGVESWIVIPSDIGVQCAEGQGNTTHFVPARSSGGVIGTITLGQPHWCYRLDNGTLAGEYPAGTVWTVYGTVYANGTESWIVIPSDIGVQCAEGQGNTTHYVPI